MQHISLYHTTCCKGSTCVNDYIWSFTWLVHICSIICCLALKVINFLYNCDLTLQRVKVCSSYLIYSSLATLLTIGRGVTTYIQMNTSKHNTIKINCKFNLPIKFRKCISLHKGHHKLFLLMLQLWCWGMNINCSSCCCQIDFDIELFLLTKSMYSKTVHLIK